MRGTDKRVLELIDFVKRECLEAHVEILDDVYEDEDVALHILVPDGADKALLRDKIAQKSHDILLESDYDVRALVLTRAGAAVS